MAETSIEVNDLGRTPRLIIASISALLTVICLLYFETIEAGLSLTFVLLALLVIAFSTVLFYRMLRYPKKRAVRYAAVLSAIYSTFFVFGRNIVIQDSVLLLEPSTWLGIILPFLPLLIVLAWLFSIFGSNHQRSRDILSHNNKHELPIIITTHKFASCFVAIFTIWGVCFLAAFPGLYTYDAITQTYYALVENTINSFHPLIHTYWLSGCLILGDALFSSYEMGMAIYSLSQMTIMAMIFSYITVTLHSFHHSRLFSALTVVFFAVFPINIILSFSSTKDVVFSGLLALLTLLTLTAILKPQHFFSSRKKVAGYVLTGILMAAFRNNGIYVLIAFAPFFIVALRGFRKNAALLCVSTIALSAIICGPVSSLISVEGSNAAEVLGLPIQQVARVINVNPSDLSLEEREDIANYIPSWKNYNSAISDPVKFSNNTSAIVSNDVSGFLSLWVQEGLKYPTVYVDAAAAMTYGYWYPWANYQDIGTTKPYLEYCMWEKTKDGIGLRWMGDHYEVLDKPMAEDAIYIYPHSLIPQLSEVLKSLSFDTPWENIPVVRMLFRPGALVWFLLFVFGIAFYRHNWCIASPLLLLVFYLGTCLMGPVFLIRYAYPLYTCLPLVLFILMDCKHVETA